MAYSLSRNLARPLLSTCVMRVLWFCILCVSFPSFASPNPSAPATNTPSIQEVQKAAISHAGLASIPDWKKRFRWSALLPDASIRFARNIALDQDLDNSQWIDYQLDQDTRFEARLEWHFSDLVAHSAEPRALLVADRLYQSREQLLIRITQLYYKRQRLAQQLSSAPDSQDAPIRQIALDEVTAQLDGLTGGFFTKAIPMSSSTPP